MYYIQRLAGICGNHGYCREYYDIYVYCQALKQSISVIRSTNFVTEWYKSYCVPSPFIGIRQMPFSKGCSRNATYAKEPAIRSMKINLLFLLHKNLYWCKTFKMRCSTIINQQHFIQRPMGAYPFLQILGVFEWNRKILGFLKILEGVSTLVKYTFICSM